MKTKKVIFTALSILLIGTSIFGFAFKSKELLTESGESYINMLGKNDDKMIMIEKEDNNLALNPNVLGFNKDDYEKIQNRYNIKLNALLTCTRYSHDKFSLSLSDISPEFKDEFDSYPQFYRPQIGGFYYLDKEALKKNNFTLVGTYPTKLNEICLTDFVIDKLDHYGVFYQTNDGEMLYLEKGEVSFDALENNFIFLGKEKFKVTGCLENKSKLDYLKTKFQKHFENYNDEDFNKNTILNYNFEKEAIYNHSNFLYVSKEYYDLFLDDETYYLFENNIFNYVNIGNINKNVKVVSSNLNEQIVYFDDDKTELKDNEIALSSSHYASLIERRLIDKMTNNELMLKEENRSYKEYSIEKIGNELEIKTIYKDFISPLDYFYNINEEVMNFVRENPVMNNLHFESLVKDFYEEYNVPTINEDARIYLQYLMTKDSLHDFLNLNKDKLNESNVNYLKRLIKIKYPSYQNFLGTNNKNYFLDFSLINKFEKYFPSKANKVFDCDAKFKYAVANGKVIVKGYVVGEEFLGKKVYFSKKFMDLIKVKQSNNGLNNLATIEFGENDKRDIAKFLNENSMKRFNYQEKIKQFYALPTSELILLDTYLNNNLPLVIFKFVGSSLLLIGGITLLIIAFKPTKKRVFD